MTRRKGRSGFYFRRMIAGKVKWIALGRNYPAACQKLRQLKSEGEHILQDVSVRQAARQWLASYVPTARQPKGQKLAARRVERYFDPLFGHLLLRRVSKEHLRSFRLYLENEGLQPRTVQHVLSDARCFFNWCEDAGLIDRSPFPRRIMPRIQERPPDRLSDEQAEQLRHLPEPYGFVCRLALATGLRWGELTRAQASDLERGFLVVHHTKSSRIRRVPLPSDVLAEVRQRVGKLVPYAEVSPGTFARTLRRMTGIEKFHCHQMRHTFACQWLERGGSLAALQQILGHASIETTQRYARLTDEVVMREAERLEVQGGSQNGSQQGSLPRNSLWPRSSDG
jgi:integrase/recombinase XerD